MKQYSKNMVPTLYTHKITSILLTYLHTFKLPKGLNYNSILSMLVTEKNQVLREDWKEELLIEVK